ncbi:MAG: class I SAM-dependent RNA methyltransferase, partial [Gemmatimonadota bacterium]|nr:class I SAM-dependent RNA methyltransferase [Gemmatimonadota bacterium]
MHRPAAPPSAEPLALFAVTAPGLEPLAAAELAGMGIGATPEPGGVAWEGTREQLFDANLRLRTASRVLLRIAEFRARTWWELERHARRVAWERWLGDERAVRLRVTSRKSKLYHQGAVAERLLQVIGVRADSIPAADAAKSDEEDERTDGQLLVARFLRDRCTLSIDTSGALLHRRGYRQALGRAPLRETLAAALLLGSGWQGQAPLIDPLCGAGTVAIE